MPIDRTAAVGAKAATPATPSTRVVWGEREPAGGLDYWIWQAAMPDWATTGAEPDLWSGELDLPPPTGRTAGDGKVADVSAEATGLSVRVDEGLVVTFVPPWEQMLLLPGLAEGSIRLPDLPAGTAWSVGVTANPQGQNRTAFLSSAPHPCFTTRGRSRLEAAGAPEVRVRGVRGEACAISVFCETRDLTPHGFTATFPFDRRIEAGPPRRLVRVELVDTAGARRSVDGWVGIQAPTMQGSAYRELREGIAEFGLRDQQRLHLTVDAAGVYATKTVSVDERPVHTVRIGPADAEAGLRLELPPEITAAAVDRVWSENDAAFWPTERLGSDRLCVLFGGWRPAGPHRINVVGSRVPKRVWVLDRHGRLGFAWIAPGGAEGQVALVPTAASIIDARDTFDDTLDRPTHPGARRIAVLRVVIPALRGRPARCTLRRFEEATAGQWDREGWPTMSLLTPITIEWGWDDLRWVDGRAVGQEAPPGG
ncbi:MAG: hypothetical protein AAF628_20155 [Planctomycetota bacterium]